MIACARLGAMICPVNWRQSGEELAFVIEDFDPKVIIWQQEEIGDQIADARGRAGERGVWIQHDSASDEGYDARVAEFSADPVPSAAEPHDALLVIYTAAIVERPAGSRLSQHNLVAMATMTERITDADHTSVFINSGPLFHSGNFQFEALPVLVMGGTNIFVRRVDGAELLQIIAAERSHRHS